MILVTHIIFGILSIACVSYATLSPSKIKLHVTYFLTAGTLLSGFIMLFTRPVRLEQACLSGIVYFGFMIIASLIARKRLVTIRGE